jgi:signal transduction histidine kinase
VAERSTGLALAWHGCDGLAVNGLAVVRRAPAAAAAAAGCLTLVSAVAAEVAGRAPVGLAAADLVAGLSLAGAGGLAWVRRPGLGLGPLLVAAAVCWFAGDLFDPLLWLYRGPLAQALLGYPDGRPRGPLAVGVAAACWAAAIVPPVAHSDAVTVVLAGALVLATVARRDRRAPAVAAAVAWGGAMAITAGARLAGGGLGVAGLWALDAAVALSAVSLVAGVTWRSLVLGGLVADLGAAPGAVGDVLAAALGDPALRLVYRAEGVGWVDEAGRRTDAPDHGGRAVTWIREGAEPVAAMVHDHALERDGELLDAAAAGARLALANVRLQAVLRASARDVAASRRRIVEAGDAQRRRLLAALCDGPERRLAEAGEALNGVDPAVAATLQAELGEVGTELRRFAAGVHPTAQHRDGLAGALTQLVAAAPGDVALEAPRERLPEPVETAVYFVCSEALANVTKHAMAQPARIAVHRGEGRVVFSIEDAGPGGADPAGGLGLRGLADRVEALGGALRVRSEAGHGTRVEGELPL